MSKHVVVIASGETERRSLPHLVAYLQSEEIARQLNAETIAQRSASFRRFIEAVKNSNVATGG